MRRTDLERSNAIKLWREGLGITQITQMTGVPRSTIGEWVRALDNDVLLKCALCGSWFYRDRKYHRFNQLVFCCRKHQEKSYYMRNS